MDRDTDYFNAPCAKTGCGKPAKSLQVQLSASFHRSLLSVSFRSHRNTCVFAKIVLWFTALVRHVSSPLLRVSSRWWSQECCDQCKAIPSCHAWTWTGACPGCSPPQYCWHKQAASGRQYHKDLFSVRTNTLTFLCLPSEFQERRMSKAFDSFSTVGRVSRMPTAFV